MKTLLAFTFALLLNMGCESTPAKLIKFSDGSEDVCCMTRVGTYSSDLTCTQGKRVQVTNYTVTPFTTFRKCSWNHMELQ